MNSSVEPAFLAYQLLIFLGIGRTNEKNDVADRRVCFE
jgi:hypothetical protein